MDWFTVEGWPLSAYDGSKPANYLAWVGNRALPKLNTDNPQVREFIMRVAEHWLRFGIDGWRLDVPFEIRTEGFWQEFRRRVKAINPEAYIVGEVWGDSTQWLGGDQFDGVMNYLWTAPTMAFTAGDRVRPEEVQGRSYEPTPALSGMGYADRIAWLLALYPWEIQLTQLNLLDSHDTARYISIAGGDKASVRLATLLLMTFPGAPSIYYGDEIGLEGHNRDEDTRRTFPWDHRETWDHDLLAYHKELIALRKAHPALRTGALKRLYADQDVYAFARTLGDETILVAVNAAEQPRTVQIPVAEHLADGASLAALYGQGAAAVSGGSLMLELPARDGAVLR
jgi:cyclomaltodextrinase